MGKIIDIYWQLEPLKILDYIKFQKAAAWADGSQLQIVQRPSQTSDYLPTIFFWTFVLFILDF